MYECIYRLYTVYTDYSAVYIYIYIYVVYLHYTYVGCYDYNICL